MISLIVIFIILMLIYAVLMLYYRYHWDKIEIFEFEESPKNPQKLNQFSILISFRNEADQLEKLFNSIKKIDYLTDHFEVIFCDDYSIDQSYKLIEDFIISNKNLTIKLLSLNKQDLFEHKKAAIYKSFKHSQFPWILSTDADCIIPQNWLKVLNEFINKENPLMVSMPVLFINKNKSYWNNWLNLEFSGLIAIGGAGIKSGLINNCNAANLAYTREIFQEFNQFEKYAHLPGGDDVFFFHQVYSHYPARVKFLKSMEVCILTEAPKSLKEFLFQRIRWASKFGNYQNKGVSVVLALVWFYHASIFISLFLAVFNPLFLYVFFILFMGKLGVDYLFYQSVFKFFKSNTRFGFYFFDSILHIGYTVLIGIIGNFGKYSWKGRKY